MRRSFNRKRGAAPLPLSHDFPNGEVGTVRVMRRQLGAGSSFDLGPEDGDFEIEQNGALNLLTALEAGQVLTCTVREEAGDLAIETPISVRAL